MKNRAISLVLCVLLCGCFFGCSQEVEQTPPASAPTVSVGGDHTVAITSATAAPGETVTLTVSISENVNVAAMDLDLKFDNNLLTYKSCKKGDAIPSGGFSDSNVLSPGHFRFTMASLTPVNDAGVLFDVTFTVNANAPAGETALKLSQSTFCDYDTKPISVTVNSGKIVIK